MKENVFQASLIRTIKNLLPGCIILKNDPNYLQGVPDLIVLYGVTWACLECKKNATAAHQPNQDYYIDKMSKMSYAAFIYPENTQQVLQDMIAHFNWINSKDFTLEEFNRLKSEKSNLDLLLSNNSYQEVAMA